MHELLSRLKNAFQKLAPSLLDKLNKKGVTDEMITALETKIGHQLPADFVAFYRLMDGEAPYANGFIFDNEELLSFTRIADEWNVWKELTDGGEFVNNTSDPDAGIKKDWYNTNWIPFTYDGSGDHLCLDFDPAAGGASGQVIRMWHDDSVRTLKHANFTEWLTAYVEDLEAGKFAMVDGYLERKIE